MRPTSNLPKFGLNGETVTYQPGTPFKRPFHQGLFWWSWRSVSSWPSLDPQMTKMTTGPRFLIGYRFSTGQIGRNREWLGAYQEKNWFIRDNLVQIGPNGKQILGEIESLHRTCGLVPKLGGLISVRTCLQVTSGINSKILM